MAEQNKSKSYRHILRASAIIGSSSMVSIVTGIAKNKLVAILLGPTGVGLFGVLQSVLNTATTIAGMGLNSSGVRTVAEALNDDSQERLNNTRNALRIFACLFGLIGGLVLAAFSKQIASLSSHITLSSIAWMSIAVWAGTVAGSQTAYINGLRRLGDLARINIAGSISGLLIAVAAIWLWKETGVVVAVVCAPITALVTSWWFVRNASRGLANTCTLEHLLPPLKSMLSLGLAFMLSALVTTGTQLLVRIVIDKSLGLTAVGHFQAAWSISMMYLGFILGAMGSDYYPRLSSVANDHETTNNMVNEQTEVILLMAGPVILCMVTFASQIVFLLYSKSFVDTIQVLRWQFCGDIFKLACWAIGFIIAAQGRSGLFFGAEFSWNALYFIFVFAGTKLYGLEMTGVAFVVSYAMLLLINMIIARRLTGFRINGNNVKIFSLLLFLATLILVTNYRNENLSIVVGCIATIVFSYISVSGMRKSISA